MNDETMDKRIKIMFSSISLIFGFSVLSSGEKYVVHCTDHSR